VNRQPNGKTAAVARGRYPEENKEAGQPAKAAARPNFQLDLLPGHTRGSVLQTFDQLTHVPAHLLHLATHFFYLAV
jgi:hypothetical protein